VEASRRQKNNKRLIEYFRVNPIRAELNLKALNLPKPEVKEPQYNKFKNELIYYNDCKKYFDNPIYSNKKNSNEEYKYYNGEKVPSNGIVMPRYKPVYQPVPILQVGKSILQRPHYNVLPNWWG